MEPNEILGTEKGASKEEIKKAFKRKAMILHPDRGGDKVKFQELTDAYEELLNGGKKKNPDNNNVVAMQQLTALFDSAINGLGDEIEHIDLVKFAKDAIKSDIKQQLRLQKTSDGKVKKWEKLKKRMRTKKNKPNLFVELINGKISIANRETEARNERMQIADLMLQMLEFYEYEKDELVMGFNFPPTENPIFGMGASS